MIYQILQQASIGGETVGYQHSPANMCGKEIYFKRPHVYMWVRERESWYQSYHRWRTKTQQHEIPGDSDLWHPKWRLEFCFDYDFDTFRANVREICPDFYEEMTKLYLNVPFEKTVYDFSDLHETMHYFFCKLGFDPGLDFFKSYPKINAS
jgi:hypothetical protein